MSIFPLRRMRRLRMKSKIREMVAETRLHPSQLICPMFICTGEQTRREIASMPGVYHFSIDLAVEECRELVALGIPAVLLFGLPDTKDEQASGAWGDDGIVQQATRAIKAALGDDLMVISDTCLCEYTSHGHCGMVSKEGEILNDATLELLQRTAVSQARAGADIIAPSDMMDGRIGAIRDAMDEAGFENVPILSYAVKYASAFYGPFRDAVQSAPCFGDRRSHQMDPANAREALIETGLDVAESADMIMVKPAGAYLDVIWRVRQLTELPVVGYQVSGEYAMLKAAGANGWIEEERAVEESILAIHRAGADLVITYFAKDLAKKWQGQ